MSWADGRDSDPLSDAGLRGQGSLPAACPENLSNILYSNPAIHAGVARWFQVS